jgi:tRNA A-37 threonylcarbamoyl transferase component Bud32
MQSQLSQDKIPQPLPAALLVDECVLHFPVLRSAVASLVGTFLYFGLCLLVITFIFHFSWTFEQAVFGAVMMVGFTSLQSFNLHWLRLSQSGINLKKHLPFFIPKKKSYSWSDLHSVALWRSQEAGGTGAVSAPVLSLDFRSGGFVRIPLAFLTAGELEQVFAILARNADPLSLNPDVLSLQRAVLSGLPELPLTSTFTDLWQESLKTQFKISPAAGLQGGDELQAGKYTILLMLAGGGFASAYLARRQDGVRVVLKETSLEQFADSKTAQKVLELSAREASILSRLQHPRIVSVLDYFVEKERSYLVLEHIAGQTLRQIVLREGAQKEARVLKWANQIIDVLSYLHGLQPPVVHRDISPDNFVVSPTNEIKLIDFGAANYFLQTHTGTVVGNQRYMAAEQIQGKAQPRSDLYSFGATLFYLLCAVEPRPLTQLSVKAMRPDVSDRLAHLVAWCTASEADERPTSAEALNAYLKTVPSCSDG